MKFTLVQEEIEQAVKTYIAGIVQFSPDADVTIEFKNTRGSDGTTAEVDVQLVKVKPTTEQVITRSTVTETTVEPTPMPEIPDEEEALKEEVITLEEGVRSKSLFD